MQMYKVRCANVKITPLYIPIPSDFTGEKRLKNCSGAPAAEGRHVEPNSYRTRAFIFVWSSLSAVNGSQARTYDDDDVAQHGAHTGQLMHCLHHFMVN